MQGLISINNADYIPQAGHGTLLTIAVISFAIILNTFLAGKMPLTEGVAVIIHICGLFGVIIPLWVMSPRADSREVLLEFTNLGNWPTEGLSAMIGLTTPVSIWIGYDCSVHMAEEIHDASRNLPKSILSAVSLNCCLGFLMAMTLIFCVGDAEAVLAAADDHNGYAFLSIFVNAVQNRHAVNMMVFIVIFGLTNCAVSEIAVASDMNCIPPADGSRVDADKVIGDGADGFIILDVNHVLKIPHLLGRLQPDRKIDAHADNDLHLQHLEVEKEVFKRLRGAPGISRCIECTNNGILLEYYPEGSLGGYISRHESPSMTWKWKWIIQATDIIARCHEKRVLVFDVALRNFFLADDFSLRLIDVANNALLPDSVDVISADVDGCTAKLNLFHLSNIIYSIMTWQKFSVRCASETEWPKIDQMPDLEGLECGQMTRDCWTKRYSTVHQLVLDMQLYSKTGM